MREPSKLTSVTKKMWGQEVTVVNNELYCGKIITINKGFCSSNGNFHYHIEKDETFYIVEGILHLEIVNEIRQLQFIQLKRGESFRIKPGTNHRFSTESKSCTFIEFSTTHWEEDSIRVSPEVCID